MIAIDEAMCLCHSLTSLLLDLAQHREQGLLHAMTIERVLPSLSLVQRLFGDVHNLLQDLANVLFARIVVAAARLRTIVLARHAVALGIQQRIVTHHTVWILHGAA